MPTLAELGKLAAPLAPGPIGLALKYGGDIVSGMSDAARRAFEEAGKLQHYGNEYYDAGPATQAAFGTIGAPAAAGGVPLGSLGAGVGPLWHGISKVKLSRPVAEMTATHVPIGQLGERVIAPEALQGGVLLPAWGDRSIAGTRLTEVGGKVLPTPVEMQGGHGFMPANVESGAAWASALPVAKRLGNQARSLAESGQPVYFPYTAMGERSVDFSHHVSDTLAEMLKTRPLPTKAAADFNEAMKTADANFPAIEDWPGLRSPKLKEYLINASGDVRNKFAKIMDFSGAEKSGLPSVAEARFAVTDPSLLNVPTGSAGRSIARLDPSGAVNVNPVTPHRTYEAQLGGQYIGGLEQSIPRNIMYPDMINAYKKLGYEPFRYDYLMQRGVTGAPIAQQADQRWVDTISKYLEANRQGQ